MHLTQFAIFEVGTGCNLGESHKALCPNRSPERWRDNDPRRPLTDAQIIAASTALYRDHGFRGLIGFHYYNEPLLYWERVRRLAEAIREREARARFVLWTNGTCVPDDPALELFSQAHVTDYGSNHPANRSRLLEYIPWAEIKRPVMDQRLTAGPSHGTAPCQRMFCELIFDAYANVHLCCHAWRGRDAIANLHDTPLGEIVSRWRAIRDAVASRPMQDDAPNVCRQCSMRHNRITPFDRTIAKEAECYVRELQAGRDTSDPSTLAVACVGDPGQMWIDHHAAFGEAKAFGDAPAAVAWLRQCGAYFGALLGPTQYLRGPVREALALHPNEAVLEVPVRRGGADAGIVSIIRRRDIASAQAGRLLCRKKRCAKVRMEELRIEDARPPATGGAAVVFVSYRVPKHRLADHFRWNDEHYRRIGARVFVVTDRDYPVSEYARCLVYPEEMQTFSLALTKNFGIRHAVAEGFNNVVSTDVDMVFDGDVLDRLVAVGEGEAIVPIYHMASGYECRETDWVEAPAATGTVAMVAADWHRAHYQEACVGYGCDDGILLRQIEREGIAVTRDRTVNHIAHQPGTPQKEFDRQTPRVDHWGRAEGFNPEAFASNRPLDKAPPTGPRWGLAPYSQLSFVVTAWRLPDDRVAAFLRWNDAAFRETRARLVIVTDPETRLANLPSYAHHLVYPGEMPTFSLARASNYGIRSIGEGVIVKADPDLVLGGTSMSSFQGVTPTCGVCPEYLMVREAGEAWGEPWPESKGCLCLHWDHWQAICGYDERMVGYGGEDADAFERARTLPGRTVERRSTVYHVAHDPRRERLADPRRRDRWNPAENPCRCRSNAVASETPWADPCWGLAINKEVTQ